MLCIKKGDMHNAIRYEAKVDDMNELVNTIRNRISGLKKEVEKQREEEEKQKEKEGGKGHGGKKT